jgi:hypothetical protein
MMMASDASRVRSEARRRMLADFSFLILLRYLCELPVHVRSHHRRLLAHLDRFRLADNLVAGKLASGYGHEGTSLSQRKE